MTRFKVTHPWKDTGNTVPLVYNTCQCIKIFTFMLPGKCVLYIPYVQDLLNGLSIVLVIHISEVHRPSLDTL